jgi:hypothetical protein
MPGYGYGYGYSSRGNPTRLQPDIPATGLVIPAASDAQLQSAIVAAVPGDVIELTTGYNPGRIYIQGGSFDADETPANYGGVQVGAGSRVDINKHMNGFAGEWVLIRSQDANSPSVIDQVQIRQGDGVFGDAACWRFEDVKVAPSTIKFMAKLEAAFCRFNRCSFAADGGSSAYMTWTPDDWQLLNPNAKAVTITKPYCQVTNCYAEGVHEGWMVAYGGNYAVITGNEINGISGDASQSNGSYGLFENNIIRNFCYDASENHPDGNQTQNTNPIGDATPSEKPAVGNVISGNDVIMFDADHPAWGNLPTANILPWSGVSSYSAGDWVYDAADSKSLWRALAGGGEVVQPSLDVGTYWEQPAYTIPAHPQGIFASDNTTSNYTVEDNLVWTLAFRGISFDKSTGFTAQRNMALRSYGFDMQPPNNYFQTGVQSPTDAVWFTGFPIQANNIADTFFAGTGTGDLTMTYAQQASELVDPYVYRRNVSHRIKNGSAWAGSGPTRLQPFTPADLTTAIWYDFADATTMIIDGSNRILSVTDKSGNANNLTGLVASAPTWDGFANSRTVANMTSSFLSMDSGNTYAQPLNIAIVSRVTSAATRSILDNQAAGVNFNLTHNSNTGFYGMAAGVSQSFGVANNALNAVCMHIDGAASRLNMNAVPGSSLVDVGSNSLQNFYLGQTDGGFQKWNGVLCEMIVWEGAYDADEWLLMLDYISYRWGV